MILLVLAAAVSAIAGGGTHAPPDFRSCAVGNADSVATRDLAATDLPRTYDGLELQRGVFDHRRGSLVVGEKGIEFVSQGERFSLPVSRLRAVSIDAGRVRLQYEDGDKVRSLRFAGTSVWEKFVYGNLPLASRRLHDVERSIATAIAHANPEGRAPAASGEIRDRLRRLFEEPSVTRPPAEPAYSFTRREGLYAGGGLGVNLVRDSASTENVVTHAGLCFTLGAGIHVNRRVALGARFGGLPFARRGR